MASYYLILDSLTCIEQDDYTGSDDINIRILGQQEIHVGEISRKQTKPVAKEMPLRSQSECIVQLWEKDMISDDYIGTVNLLSGPIDQLTSADFQNDKAHYRLFYTVVQQNN